MSPDDERLLDLYRLHTEEVRYQVLLSWDRAKSSMAFHTALLALIASLDRIDRRLAVAMFLFTAVSALLGAGMIQVGHSYYRVARDQRKRVEAELKVPFGFVSTPGQRGDVRRGLERYWPKVTSILVLLHFMLAGLSLAGAFVYWP
jgi:hypothetical protein